MPRARSTFPRRLKTKREAAARHLLVGFCLLAILANSAPTASAQEKGDGGVVRLSGDIALTDPLIVEDPNEPFALLANIDAFITGDFERTLESGEQVLGPITGSLDDASYTLQLPAQPTGASVDATPGDDEDSAVSVFAVDVAWNLIGDTFLEDREFPSVQPYLSTLSFDPETYNINGGRLIVWADKPATFPSGLGEDGLLFSSDDPVDRVESGWTVVDLGEAGGQARRGQEDQGFDFLRELEVEADIIAGDTGHTDYADLSFTDAFDELAEDLAEQYVFFGFKDFELDPIVEEYRPLIEAAEEDDDAEAFQLAIKRFSLEFGDGHVGATTPDVLIEEAYGGDYGLRLGETDDGEVIVADILGGGAAEEAGIEVGATITEWGGEPVDDAIDAQPLLNGESAAFGARLQRIRLLPRTTVGTEVEVTFVNPKGDEETAELTAQQGEPIGRPYLSPGSTVAEQPVSSRLLPSGVGYIRVSSFSADNNLAVDAWELAISQLIEADARALIVDVRGNGGGRIVVANYFAGTFIDEELVLGEYAYPNGNGELVGVGSDVVTPSPVQWDRPVAVLVDDGCASACEYFSAAVAAADEANLVVGSTPSAGVYAGIAPWTLPADTYFQASVVAFTVDDEVFLEGEGVQPTLDVPVTEESILSPDDEVLSSADEALLEVVEETEGEATPETDET